MEEKLYEFVADDKDDGPPREGIREEAVGEVPRNFGRQVLASVGSKTGDQLSKPGVILTWLLTVLGAPTAAIGMLAPVREAGSLLPQIAIGSYVQRFAHRKGFWVAGSLLQGGAVIAMGFAALLCEGAVAGWTIVGLLAVFSLSRGINSVVSKDILGRTIPKSRRGRLGGLAASISGWTAVVVGLAFVFQPAGELPVGVYAVLLFVAGALWVAAAFAMGRIVEPPAETEHRGGKETLAVLRHLRDDRIFLRFCLARALLASTVLSMPFYVVLAHEATGGKSAALGLLMLAGSLASALSGVTWGKMSDQSSRRTLAIAGLAAGLVGCLTAGLSGIEFGSAGALWVYGLLFFLIGLAHTGIRSGRKTYLVDHADAGNRAELVAVSNTLMGVVLLASGAFGLLAESLGERVVILVFALLGIVGAFLAWTLPEIGSADAD